MKPNRFLTVFMLVITIFSLFAIGVCADEETHWCNTCQENHTGSFPNSITKFAWEMNDVVNSGNIFDTTTNEVLKLNMTGSGNVSGETYDENLANSFQNMWTALKTPYDTIALPGKILLIIYVMIEAIQQTSIKTISIEDVMKMIMKCAIGIIVIENGYMVLSLIIDLGSGLFDTIYSASVQSSAGINVCNFETAIEYSPVEAIGSMLSNLIPWLIIQFAKVVVFVAAWSRILEIGARTVMAPLGMADIITEGQHGNGMRYLRKYFACALQGAVIMASTKVYGATVSVLPINLITHCALTVVLIVIMFRSRDYAEQIAGV